MRTLPTWTLALLVATLPPQDLTAQEPTDRAERDTARALAFAELLLELEKEPLPSIAQRQKLLLDFVDVHQHAPDSLEVLGARLRLGILALQRLDTKPAIETLADVAQRAESVDADLRGRALFAQCQAHLMAKEPQRARETLQVILREHEDDAIAGVARIALARLDETTELRVGKPMPPMEFGVDLAERRIEANTFAAGPRLYVFWSFAHQPSQRRLEACARVWRKLGLPDENLIAYAADDDTGALRRLAQQRRWTFRVLAAGADGFLHPDWIRLGVTAVPTTMLVGEDGVLLATDLSPDRLESVFREK